MPFVCDDCRVVFTHKRGSCSLCGGPLRHDPHTTAQLVAQGLRTPPAMEQADPSYTVSRIPEPSFSDSAPTRIPELEDLPPRPTVTGRRTGSHSSAPAPTNWGLIRRILLVAGIVAGIVLLMAFGPAILAAIGEMLSGFFAGTLEFVGSLLPIIFAVGLVIAIIGGIFS